MPLSLTVTLPSGKTYNQPTGIFYDNEFHASLDGNTFETIDPATGKSICSVQEAREADVDAAVAAAKRCFETTLDEVTPAERGELLNKLADAVEQHRDVLAAIESMDGGKPYAVAHRDDVGELIGVLRYYAGFADKIHGKTIDTGKDRLTYVLKEPIGVCGQVIPWNFPLSMASWKIGPALACGNTVVLKPAEQTPLSVLYLCSLAKDILPKGMLNVVPGFGRPAGAHLVAHPDVRKVAFTGSTAVGREIMKRNAESPILKKLTLELGGKSPLIVLDDADIDQAVKWAHLGMFYNQSQVCCATTRIIVHAGVYDQFCKQFVAHTKATSTVALPHTEESFQGPQISQVQTDKILKYIQSGKDEGATVLLDGGRSTKDDLKNGFFIDPTIFSDVTPNMTIAKEEIFGPVASILKASSLEEAVKIANDTSYGLGAAVFSQNIRRAHQVARKLQAGQVWINSSNDGAPSIPFGGYKNSGIGRELGEYALDNYTETKAVMVNLGVDL
ncbi:mitochondrial aldehyde dehydrogenase [Savitreella phatthalungensis]